jgi:hypothetical protein
MHSSAWARRHLTDEQVWLHGSTRSHSSAVWEPPFIVSWGVCSQHLCTLEQLGNEIPEAPGAALQVRWHWQHMHLA